MGILTYRPEALRLKELKKIIIIIEMINQIQKYDDKLSNSYMEGYHYHCHNHVRPTCSIKLVLALNCFCWIRKQAMLTRTLVLSQDSSVVSGCACLFVNELCLFVNE